MCTIWPKLGSKPRGKIVRSVFEDVGKSDKITKHETKEYHKDALEKAKDFLESYEDPTKSVTHEKNSDKKYKRNIHIRNIEIKFKTEFEVKLKVKPEFKIEFKTEFDFELEYESEFENLTWNWPWIYIWLSTWI